MLPVARAIAEVVCDLLGSPVYFCARLAQSAWNLVLRKQLAAYSKQLAAYIERGVRPRRVDHAGRVSLSVLSRLFNWRDAIVIVGPSTVVRWHRLGWRIFWRWKSRAGRLQILPELQRLIRQMATANPLWG